MNESRRKLFVNEDFKPWKKLEDFKVKFSCKKFLNKFQFIEPRKAMQKSSIILTRKIMFIERSEE
jgi:hypothetical protein